MPPVASPTLSQPTTTPAAVPLAADPKASAAEPKKEGATTNIAPAAKPPTEAQATNQGEAAVRKYKLKVDGQELELDEPEVIARAQKSSAADKRFQEAMQARKEAESFVEMLRTDFTKLLDNPKLGLEEAQKRKMLEDYYKAKYIDPETLSPEQLEQQKMQAELNRYRDTEKERAEAEQRQRLEALERHHAENYEKMFVQALQTEGLPKTPYTVKRMAELTMKSAQMGLDLTPEQLATEVRKDYLNEIKSVLGATDGDMLLGLLGDDVANKLRKADLARLKAGIPQVPQPVIETPKTAQENQPVRAYQTFDEMRADRERRVRELEQSRKR